MDTAGPDTTKNESNQCPHDIVDTVYEGEASSFVITAAPPRHDALPKGGCFQYTTGATGRWVSLV
ncbi:hypothetical protein CTAM01_02159 [Colletotrichum tamarilloi]|uniref:Uncharacterized protein n=1 Tax=Colletotrichum tamarilloi TaxID=1209934 RepID=A0ABQ9RN27_9PEZI|nr:uncharacterized protein CTAM01_02159 [Colletotrichum tamarilloi]KAK1508373.1 hypothetical protein CTAM01_02159 [Colletotrichum tamarilloi]